MKLKNKTRDRVLSDNIGHPKNLKERSVGLLGKDEPESIYLQTRFGIHTIGMNFPIDCIVADDNMVIRKIKKELEPGRLFLWNPKYRHVFELPPGTIKETNTHILDKLIIYE